MKPFQQLWEFLKTQGIYKTLSATLGISKKNFQHLREFIKPIQQLRQFIKTLSATQGTDKTLSATQGIDKTLSATETESVSQLHWRKVWNVLIPTYTSTNN